MIRVRTIWSVSKSGSALHARISSDIAVCARSAGSRIIPPSVTWPPYERGEATESSVSLGHAARNPEVGNGQSLLPPRDPGSLTGWVSTNNQGDRQSLDF